MLYWASESAAKHLWGRQAHKPFLRRIKPFLQAVHLTLYSHQGGCLGEKEQTVRPCPGAWLCADRLPRPRNCLRRKRKSHNKHKTRRDATTTSHWGTKTHSLALIWSAWLSMTRKCSEEVEVGENTLNLSQYGGVMSKYFKNKKKGHNTRKSRFLCILTALVL